MNHLPQLDYPAEAYPRVPLLDREEYDHGPFDSYPERRGKALTQQLLRFDSATGDDRETAPVFQTWLYFGALREIFALDHISKADWMHVDDEGAWVSTEKLNGCIRTWGQHMDSLE